MRLLLCLVPAVFAGALAACGGSSAGSGAGGDGAVASTSGPSGSTASVGSGGASASSSDMASSAASTGAGGGGDPSIAATVDPTTIKAGDMATVTVTVENFKLVPPGGNNVPGEGHYHVYLDGATGGNYLAAGQTPTKPITIPAATTPGMHTLRVNISNNDHSPLNPPVEDVIPITVE